MKIRACEQKDLQQICDIYNYYVTDTVITFEDQPVSVAQMEHRLALYTQNYPWLVCEVNEVVLGYAYATAWRERAAYKNSVEITVYIKHLSGKNGYGQALYQALLAALEGSCHAIMAGIALPNSASVKLHEKFGFKQCAHFKEVGFKLGTWVDVGYWQKNFKD